MYGNCMGTLKVYQSVNGQERMVWEMVGNQGQRWLVQRLTLAAMGNDYKVGGQRTECPI
jgi:hypothetical protein